MNVEDIRLENDIYVYLGSKLNAVEEVINRIFGTQNITFLGTEWDIPKYHYSRRIYGGGRVDMMFANSEMLVPTELKYEANASSYGQIKKYVDMIKEKEKREVNGILLCVHATKSLKQLDIDDNIAIIQLSPWKVW